MSLSRMHFVAVARVLNETYTPSDDCVHTRDNIARDLADVFAKWNPSFDRARFLEAAGVADT